MTYSSTVTSKGTITLPAALRAKLGIKEGDKVTISLEGNNIVAKTQLDWDDFFSSTYDFGEKARQMIQNKEVKSLLTNADIAHAVRQARSRRHAKH